MQLFSDASPAGDVERIGFKGPQGVLYGGSNIGGAVKYVSKTPSTEEMGGRLKILAGEQGIWDVEGDINVPRQTSGRWLAFAFTREVTGSDQSGSLSSVFGWITTNPRMSGDEQSGGRLILHGDISAV